MLDSAALRGRSVHLRFQRERGRLLACAFAQTQQPVLRNGAFTGTIAFSERSRADCPRADERNGDELRVAVSQK